MQIKVDMFELTVILPSPMFTDVRAFTRAAFSKESTVDTTKEEEGGASLVLRIWFRIDRGYNCIVAVEYDGSK